MMHAYAFFFFFGKGGGGVLLAQVILAGPLESWKGGFFFVEWTCIV